MIIICESLNLYDRLTLVFTQIIFKCVSVILEGLTDYLLRFYVAKKKSLWIHSHKLMLCLCFFITTINSLPTVLFICPS